MQMRLSQLRRQVTTTWQTGLTETMVIYGCYLLLINAGLSTEQNACISFAQMSVFYPSTMHQSMRIFARKRTPYVHSCVPHFPLVKGYQYNSPQKLRFGQIWWDTMNWSARLFLAKYCLGCHMCIGTKQWNTWTLLIWAIVKIHYIIAPCGHMSGRILMKLCTEMNSTKVLSGKFWLYTKFI